MSATTPRVRFLDMRRVTYESRAEIDGAVARVIGAGRYILGNAVVKFEVAFRDAIGAASAVGVGSGTDAIEIALRAVGVRAGDEVVTQANTCPPTISAIARIGAVPVLCDVDGDSALMDPDSLLACIGRSTRAIVPVHLYGQCADMAAITGVAAEHGVPVVEDCAQAHLASFEGRAAGTMGAAGCFSFYPTKNLGGLGDGGMVVSADHALEQVFRSLRQYAAFGIAEGLGFGTNSRLDELQAAILNAKLPRLRAWTARRAAIADRYRVALGGSSVRPLALDPRGAHAHHLFVIRAENRDATRTRLLKDGIETMIHYPVPIHRLPAYAHAVRTPVALLRAERLATQVLSVPLYPQMSDAEVDAVAAALSRC